MQLLDTRYKITETFEYNKEHGPFEDVADVNPQINELLGDMLGVEVDFFGFRTRMPLGVAAGPLYNTRYMHAAALDGFSVITWKTFRSVDRLAHRNDGSYLGHNIVYIDGSPISPDDLATPRVGSLTYEQDPVGLSITNSFGMPSSAPSAWMPTVQETEAWMRAHNKETITSVVGTPNKDGADGGIDDLADDYAHTATCAEEAGARIIELNFSCPNVSGKEGSIYKDENNAKTIATRVRDRLKPDTKLLIKVGYADAAYYEALLRSLADAIDGVVAINTIPMEVVDEAGKQALPGGRTSGICGKAILPMAVEAVGNLARAKRELGVPIKVVGCGGVMAPEDVMQHLDAGAEYVMCATAALFHPTLPLELAQYFKDNSVARPLTS